MVLTLDFKGPMAPVFTPFFKGSNELNIDVIPKYAEYISKAGIKGVLVNGTAGEGISMPVEERKLVLESWMKVAKHYNLTVMVQIAGTNFRDVLQLAKHAESLGVSAILCLPDLFFRPKTVIELVNYLKMISEAALNTPLFYYHIPSYTGVTLDMVELLQVGKQNIKTFSGIKFTHNNLQEGTEAVNFSKNELKVFLGNEQTLAGACALGFDSCLIIGINLVPDVVIKIMENIKNNNNEMALKYQARLSDVIAKIVKDGGFMPCTKAACSYITGLELGDTRPPQVALNSKQLSDLKSTLTELNLI